MNYTNIEVDGEIETLLITDIKIEQHDIWCLVKFDEGDFEWRVLEIENIFDSESEAWEATVF